jgi:hypothetical protein
MRHLKGTDGVDFDHCGHCGTEMSDGDETCPNKSCRGEGEYGPPTMMVVYGGTGRGETRMAGNEEPVMIIDDLGQLQKDVIDGARFFIRITAGPDHRQEIDDLIFTLRGPHDAGHQEQFNFATFADLVPVNLSLQRRIQESGKVRCLKYKTLDHGSGGKATMGDFMTKSDAYTVEWGKI